MLGDPADMERLPNDMLVVAIDEHGGPEQLIPSRRQLPAPSADEVLIQVSAAGVNGPDLAQRRGHYAPPPGASDLPGLEVAGTVAALGERVSGISLGAEVMALTNGGGYAEFVSVPAGQVLPVPLGWTLAEAAALPETWFTLTQTLVMRAGLAPGMTVMIHGASGGIGGAAIQIATILGARAIAVVSSVEKASYARQLGAWAAIDTSDTDLVAEVTALTGGRGVDRIVDVIGGPMTALNVALSARGGHIVQISTLGGADVTLPLRQMMAKDLTLSGSTLRPQSAATKAAIATRLRSDLLPALADPDCPRPRISTFPLPRASDAHRLMETRTHIGKLVLTTDFGRGETQS